MDGRHPSDRPRGTSLDPTINSLTHRADATVRWITNCFLDVIAGCGQRPQCNFSVTLGICDTTVMIGPATAIRVPEDRLAGVIVGTDEEPSMGDRTL
jgi:hypothetical protein